VREICRVLNKVLKGLADGAVHSFERLRNVPLTEPRTNPDAPLNLRDDVLFALEMLTSVEPPSSQGAFQFNFDVSDLTPVASWSSNRK